ncbi:germin-like protein subfamily 1 member 13 isoform X3 [Durio zibethinus]|uniref:Germin-like protein n=1 Tax=Durio zibethinus TaxID=66656 RepID=A0A6P5WWK9_DURZI|nr:germin-like protein subfamily 1 member 13 isoform X3 [Durio zibethinus]
MKGVNHFLVVFAFLALASTLASASDPSSLMDFCVALNGPKNAGMHSYFVNGKFCKDPKLATADDFFFSGLDKAGNTSNAVGSKVTPVNADQIPGLNTLGISLVRTDYAPYGGLNPPHSHPRGTEILVVIKVGLIHFQLNIGKTDAIAFAGLSSQNPGVIIIANAVFDSNPPINPGVLTKAFKLEKKVAEYLQTQF